MAEAREQEPELSVDVAVMRIGTRAGVSPDTLRGWVKEGDIDTGRRPVTTSLDAARIRELERENRELKRANEILLAAMAVRRRSGEDGSLSGLPTH